MSERINTILEKADTAIADFTDKGYLNNMQANEFIRKMQNQPTLLHDLRLVPMNAPVMEINKIYFANRILKPATSATALAPNDRSKTTQSQVKLTTTEIIAEVHIPYDVLEDQIERARLEDTIMDLIAERASLDLEDLVLNGNTVTGDDAFMRLKDGALAQSVSHIVDYRDSYLGSVNKGVFKEGIKAMPNQYLRNRKTMRFYVSPHAEIEYADSLADRATKLGDRRVVGDWGGNYAFGVPVAPAALMPNASGLLIWPKNLILGVQRQIMVETDRDIRARVLVVVLTMRIDIKYEEEDATVKILGIDVGAGPTTSSTTTTTSP